MFTGIVEERGRVRHVEDRDGGRRFEVEADVVLADAALGASIALDGCCLTVVELGQGWWAAEAQPETLQRSTLATLGPGDAVNLERPLRLADRLGGHLVQGHVDGTGRVVGRDEAPDGSLRLRVALPAELARYVVHKGSIAIDGVSLTVASLAGDAVEVALVAHTLATTTLGTAEIGDPVNLEVDLVAKYVERLAVPGAPERS